MSNPTYNRSEFIKSETSSNQEIRCCGMSDSERSPSTSGTAADWRVINYVLNRLQAQAELTWVCQIVKSIRYNFWTKKMVSPSRPFTYSIRSTVNRLLRSKNKYDDTIRLISTVDEYRNPISAAVSSGQRRVFKGHVSASSTDTWKTSIRIDYFAKKYHDTKARHVECLVINSSCRLHSSSRLTGRERSNYLTN